MVENYCGLLHIKLDITDSLLKPRICVKRFRHFSFLYFSRNSRSYPHFAPDFPACGHNS